MSKIKNLTNLRFGKLLVIRRASPVNGRSAWECNCDCGRTVIKNSKYLLNGDTKSCGCLVKEKQDLMGKRFGKLVVIGRAAKEGFWSCKCDCGNVKDIRSQSLTRKNRGSKMFSVTIL